MNWLFLAVAIVAEVIATCALKASEGFSKLMPSMLVVVGYGIAFYMLSRVLSAIPVGIAYAIWSGAGIVLVSLVGLFFYKQRLDFPAMLGIALIIAGVVVMQVFSKTSGH
jgi:small multidrug resistance pump